MSGKSYKRRTPPSWMQQLLVATVATFLGGLLLEMFLRAVF